MNETIKILLVDDDEAILQATARVVASEGYEVLTAESGARCMDLVQEHRPDLILLDVVLIDANGTEICRELKSASETRGIFIILLSGSKTSSDAQAEGLDVGADGYIARPLSNRELKARVNAMVRILVAERERDRLIGELQEAMAKIEVLNGLLPICCYCKQIRDDEGYWSQVEEFIGRHSGAEFSHGICPSCEKEHFGGYAAEPDAER